MSDLPPYASRNLVAERLPLIFPEGISNRSNLLSPAAISTVFVMLYIGAVDGAKRPLQPLHVYAMTEEHAALIESTDREAYRKNPRRAERELNGTRWYADNTRETIRDDVLREALLAIGAIVREEKHATTSNRPRYAMQPSFAALFNPLLSGEDFEEAIVAFQQKHLSKSALARVSIMLSGAAGSGSTIPVRLPSGETRNMAPGPSSIITKAVVEEFAPRFLRQPAVLWLSESGNKVVAQDDKLATSIGLEIRADRDLPDLILVDLGNDDPLIVFVEAVATDGPISARRQEALYALTDAGGFDRSQIAFVTAFQDRESAGFRKTVSVLAWGSSAWFASEPDKLVILDPNPSYLG
jgi:hypothetical protein